jgi:hypothetical protein
VRVKASDIAGYAYQGLYHYILGQLHVTGHPGGREAANTRREPIVQTSVSVRGAFAERLDEARLLCVARTVPP